MRVRAARRILFWLAVVLGGVPLPAQIRREVAVPLHLQDGQEFTTPLMQLLTFGESLFTANWTSEERGGGRSRGCRRVTGIPSSSS
jgi:hypothetical protein